MAEESARRDGNQTGEVVRNTAIDLIFERGYHGTSLRAVAKAVGVQMSSLYYYYPSKQALLVAIIERTMNDLIESVGSAIAEASSPQAKLIAGIRGHVLFHADRRKEVLIADSELRSLEPATRSAIISLRRDYERLFTDVLEAGRVSGVFDVKEMTVSVAGLFAMLNGVATWYRPNARLTLSEIADQFCQIFLNGIASRKVPIKSGR